APEYAGTDMATIFDPRFVFSDLSQGATTCNLSFGNGDASPNCDVEYEYPIKDTGRFDVKQVVTNQFGCVDSIVNQVFVVPEFLVYAPNAFSPNNDGKNDVFLPSALGILEFDLKVFNRFGEVIFESRDAGHGWDGAMSNGGGIAPIGVYAYRLMLTRNSGERVERIGSVTLVK
ncbi:MAG: gliding motility-associated C-terminal domain-containing protein, partial [Bacteroidota bacterium]